jgi:hypothetical protein
MSSKFRVVCFGHDLKLLETRQLLLAGRYDAYTANNLPELSELAKQGQVDLLVLCHTLSEEECLIAAEIIRAASPGVSDQREQLLQSSVTKWCKASMGLQHSSEKLTDCFSLVRHIELNA